MKLIQAFIELLKVKSIITLLIVGTMSYLAVTKQIEPATFMAVAGSVVTYYFTRTEKKFGESEANQFAGSKFTERKDGEKS